MREPVIELEDVSVAFGDKQVLDGLSLTVYRGETVFVVGRSGSGKTVLIKTMIGLVAPDRGRVRLFGRDLAEASPVELLELRKRIGVLFQNYALFDALSVTDNVEFPLIETAHVSHSDAAAPAHELIELLGLGGSEDVLPGELSGGMRKRVALARALVARPELVLFDEPTTGLDPIMVEQVDEMIARAKERYGISAVVIGHDIASVQRLANRVAFLHEGKVVFDGTPPELLASELPPIRAFLGERGATSAAAPVTADAPVIRMQDVHKHFGDKYVLRGLDLAIYPRRITVLIGASGSGKSVIVKHMLGLMKPDRGRIEVLGKDIVPMGEHELEAARGHFGLVFQHGALLDWLSVEDNVAFPLVEARRVPRAEIAARVDGLLARLDLTAIRRRMPGELSTGEGKRVALARAMVMRPEILIYDEPTTGQDPQRTNEIDELIVQTQARFDITTIVISHDMESTFRIAHTIAMLHEGRVIAYGTPAELTASTNEQVQRFLRAGAT